MLVKRKKEKKRIRRRWVDKWGKDKEEEEES